MKKWVLLAGCMAGITGCTDETALVDPAVKVQDAPRASVSCDASAGPDFCAAPSGTPGIVRQYWKSDSELWAYDISPEAGVNHHFPPDGNYLHKIRNANVRMVRLSLYWDETDPENDGIGPRVPGMPLGDQQFYTMVDLTRTMAQDWGLVPLVIILPHKRLPGNLHSGDPTPAQVDAARNAFTTWVGTSVDAMPHVRFWQVLNESDGGWWGIPMLGLGGATYVNDTTYVFDRALQGRNYARLLKSVYPAIKSRNPNAWIVSAGLTGTPYISDGGTRQGADDDRPISTPGWQFLDAFYQEGGAPFVDFLAFHAYGNAYGDHTGVFDKAQQIKAVADRYGDYNRPLWVTETGRGAEDMLAALNITQAQLGADAGRVFDEDQANHYQSILNAVDLEDQVVKVFSYTATATHAGEAPSTTGLASAVGGCGPKGYCEPGDFSLSLFRLDGLTERPSYHRLQSHPMNPATLAHKASNLANLRVHAPLKRPVGYSYTRDGSDVIVHNVVVNKLAPTRIRFENEQSTCYPQLICS